MSDHYDYLMQHFVTFYQKLCQVEGLPVNSGINDGLIIAHGDKCYQYREEWAEGGLSFEHGVAIYLLSFISPWSSEVRETPQGWVKVAKWVVLNARRFLPHLPPCQSPDAEKPDE